jgi:hypothetical protein
MQKSILPPTAKRVRLHTNEEVNNRIQQETNNNIEHYRNSSKDEIKARIKELDKEWDIERALEANAAAIITISTILGLATRRRGWFAFTGVIGAFLLQHALQGWCPPLPIFRRLGIRTSDEIDEEKFFLKKLL